MSAPDTTVPASTPAPSLMTGLRGELMRHLLFSRMAPEHVDRFIAASHQANRGQLCTIPADAIFEPCYETGKAVRWRIEREDGRPMGLACLWERKLADDGRPSWSMTMLTINADNDPLFRRFHKPEDEKRSVVILPDDTWGDWLRCKSDRDAAGILAERVSAELVTHADPREQQLRNLSGHVS